MPALCQTCWEKTNKRRMGMNYELTEHDVRCRCCGEKRPIVVYVGFRGYILPSQRWWLEPPIDLILWICRKIRKRWKNMRQQKVDTSKKE